MNTIQDVTQREQIIHNLESNIFVEAGAGSGKTTAMVGRMVALIKEKKRFHLTKSVQLHLQ